MESDVVRRSCTWNQGDMRSSRTTEDLLRTDRNEHQDIEVENWQGGARYISAVDMLPDKVHADIHWHATYGDMTVEP